MTLDQIKAQYPNIDVNLGGGSDHYQEGKPVVERNNIAVIVQHPTEDKYLIAQWKKSDWNGFVTGGIEPDKTIEQITREEIVEETGYKNIASIQTLDSDAHGLFYHPVKNENRLAHYQLVSVKLADLEQDEVSEKEKSIADFNWFQKDEIANLLTRDDMKQLWNAYLETVK